MPRNSTRRQKIEGYLGDGEDIQGPLWWHACTWHVKKRDFQRTVKEIQSVSGGAKEKNKHIYKAIGVVAAWWSARKRVIAVKKI